MTSNFDMQSSIEKIIPSDPLQRGKLYQINCQSGVTTRSGTPEAKGPCYESSNDSSFDSPTNFTHAEPESGSLDIG